MAIGRITGRMLKTPLERNSTDLVLSTDGHANTLKIDATNGRIGIRHSSPSHGLTVDGIGLNDNVIETIDSNANLELRAAGTGKVSISGLLYPSSDGSQNQFLRTDGVGNLSWATVSLGDLSVEGSTLQSPSNADITLSPGGTGSVVINSVSIRDNIIQTNESNANLQLSANGTGTVLINSLSFPTGTGALGQVMVSDGNGNLSFTDIATTLDAVTINGATTTNAITTGGVTANGDVTVTGTTFTDRIQSTGSNADVVLDPQGTGVVRITSNILPDTNTTYDIGSDSLRFNDIYLAGTTVDIGGTKIQKTADGDVEIKDSSNVRKKIIVDEIEVGSGAQKVRIARGGDGKIKFFEKNDDADTETTSSIFTVVGDDSTGQDFNSGETLKVAGGGGITTAVSGDTLTITGSDADTGDITFNGSTIQSPSNANITLDPGGTGSVDVVQGTKHAISTTDGTDTYVARTYLLWGQTTDDSETELFIGGNSGSRIPVGTNTTISYSVQIAARRTDQTGESAAWELKAVADSFSGTVADVGLVYEVIVARDDTNWTVDARADDENNSVNIFVTGATGKTIRWVAEVETVEVSS